MNLPVSNPAVHAAEIALRGFFAREFTSPIFFGLLKSRLMAWVLNHSSASLPLLTASKVFSAEASPWLERSVSKADPDELVLYLIGEKLLEYDDELARQYLKQAIAAGQLPGQAHLTLSRLEGSLGNTKESKKHLNESGRIARKTNDRDLAEKVELARMMADGPEVFMERLMEMGGPELLKDFLINFGNAFDEDGFYDF